MAANGPDDPAPELVIENGVVVRMDGRAAAEFDVIDRFLVEHGLDLEVAAEAMALSDLEIARMLVDVDVPRSEVVRLARGLTPAKLARVAGLLDPVELMFALKKLRARRAPGESGARDEPEGEPGAARSGCSRGLGPWVCRAGDDRRRGAVRAAERDLPARRLADGPARA